MSSKIKGELEKAKGCALLLLKFRLRSENEIHTRLKEKKFSEGAIKETVSFLKEKGALNDELFAKAWAASGIRRDFALRRIREELKLKGIDEEIIDRQIEKIKGDYSEEGIIEKIAREKLNNPAVGQTYKAKRRIFNYFLRRGFSPDIISDIISQL